MRDPNEIVGTGLSHAEKMKGLRFHRDDPWPSTPWEREQHEDTVKNVLWAAFIVLTVAVLVLCTFSLELP